MFHWTWLRTGIEGRCCICSCSCCSASLVVTLTDCFLFVWTWSCQLQHINSSNDVSPLQITDALKVKQASWNECETCLMIQRTQTHTVSIKMLSSVDHFQSDDFLHLHHTSFLISLYGLIICTQSGKSCRSPCLWDKRAPKNVLMSLLIKASLAAETDNYRLLISQNSTLVTRSLFTRVHFKKNC